MNIYLFHSILIHTVIGVILLRISINTQKNFNNKKYYIDFISSKPQVIEHMTPNNLSSQKKDEDSNNTKINETKSEKNETNLNKTEIKDKPVKKQKQIDDPDYLYKNISKLKPSMAQETPRILNEPIIKNESENKINTTEFTPNQGGIKTDSDFPYPWYISKLRSKLWDSWQEQIITAKDVSVVVKFKIDRNGEIKDIEINKSSGNKLFDYSALNSVIRIKNFEPLPSDFKDNYLTVYVEFKSSY